MKHNPLKRVIERSCTDAAYRVRLLADPRAVLSDAGIDVPPDVEVRIHESRDDKLVIVLPAAGESALGDAKCRLPVGPVADVPTGLTLEWQQTLNLPKRTLAARGRIDAETAGALRREIERAFVDIDLDLGGVDFLSSAGLGALVAAQQSLRSRGCAMCLRLVPVTIRNVLEAAGLIDLFEIYDAVEYKKLFPKGAGFLFGGVAPSKPVVE